MKGILEFDLRDDQKEFETAINADKYKSIIWELDQYLRQQIKYNADNLSNDTISAFELIRDKIREELNDYSISIE
jgi:hypothetical protein